MIPAINAELAKTGNYKIEWNEAYGGTLAKLGSELETIEQGISDMGMVSTILQSGKMPLQNVTYYVPFGPEDVTVVTEAMDDLHAKLPALRKSWERYNQVYLVGGAIDNYDLITNFPVNKVEDLQGKKIAGGGPSLTWIKGTGAVSVVANLATFYNDIKTGVYDGVVLFATGATGAKLYEVAPYYTKIGFGAMYAICASVNKARWDFSRPRSRRRSASAPRPTGRTLSPIKQRAPMPQSRHLPRTVGMSARCHRPSAPS